MTESLPLDHQDLATIIENADLRYAQRLTVYVISADPTSMRRPRMSLGRVSLLSVPGSVYRLQALEALVSVVVTTRARPPGWAVRAPGMTLATISRLPLSLPGVQYVSDHFAHARTTRSDKKLDQQLHEHLSRRGFEVAGYRLELVG